MRSLHARAAGDRANSRLVGEEINMERLLSATEWLCACRATDRMDRGEEKKQRWNFSSYWARKKAAEI